MVVYSGQVSWGSANGGLLTSALIMPGHSLVGE